MGTLYVVGVPAGHPADFTLRAIRILGEVALVASDHPGMQDLLVHHQIATPCVEGSSPERILDYLDHTDVALLYSGMSLGTMGPNQAIIKAAIENKHPVVPIPGPTMPLTALAVSGLPASSFVYLDQLPGQQPDRRDFLAAISSEQRTLVAQISQDVWPGILSELYEEMGDRPLAVTALGQELDRPWRGSITEALEHPSDMAVEAPGILVIGGASAESESWQEDHLRAELQRLLAQGLGVKETSRKLAVESGWSRREIYRMAIEERRTSVGE